MSPTNNPHNSTFPSFNFSIMNTEELDFVTFKELYEISVFLKIVAQEFEAGDFDIFLMFWGS